MDAARLARLTALGLHDGTPDRLALLELLAAAGADDDEMLLAHREGRLFALGGDRIMRLGRPVHTLDEAADRIGIEPAQLLRLWRAAALPEPPAGEPALSDREVEAFAVLGDVAQLLGLDGIMGVVRVLGAAMSRVAEAETSAIRQAMQDIDLGVSGSEAATAVAWQATAALIPRVGLLLDVVHRRHLETGRAYFEKVAMRGHGTEATLGVGFVDLSGFTALSATTTLPGLSRLLSIFEERASDTVLTGGGRLVKFLGDAVMYVAASRAAVARIALDLVHDPIAAEAGITVRGGIAWGDVLVQDGDYFGSPVNLAARLVALAAPTSVLGSPELAGVEGATTEILAPQAIRGFDTPVSPVLVSR